MHKAITLAVSLAFLLAAGAADAKQCRDKSGKFVKCPTTAAAPTKCKDPKTGKFVKCSAPGAVPVPTK
jgi:hypothetical protein